MKKWLGTVLAFALMAGVSAQAEDIKGDAQAGGRKTALCLGCHGIVGFKTGFPEVTHVPKIWGQSAKYVASALGEYKRGDRKHPSMRGVAETLTEQDMADLGAYFSSFGSSTPSAAKSGAHAPGAEALVTKGGCTGCHGADFNKPIDAVTPRLAGQYEDYLYFALKSYKTTSKPMIGRTHAIMGAMTQQFSDAELKSLAGYISALPGTMITAQSNLLR